MKVVILAGGRGSRLSEETYLKPKPMVEIGDAPILWHIMKIYSYYGYHDFVICCGYKGEMIKEYFMDYYMQAADITVDLSNNSYVVHENVTEPWKVTLVDTGLETNTSGRIMRIRKYLNEEPFMLTYGDGVSNVNIKELVKFHKAHKKIATITAAKPAGRWGAIQINDGTNSIETFREKECADQAWVNSGFAVFEPELFQYLTDETQQLEKEPYDRLVKDGQMIAYKHFGFWHPMDTVNDRAVLQSYWKSGQAPWKIW
ncbi:glucose-1-phosphate cytidylyltransferase [bacterium D16-51]|nr:glucose-1-phosphate cytidylyltransferase [bacterium D16-59]RKI62817.1 glucose-1-phosphate cytidylyltransferase [bacterium D16-51]